MEKFWLEVKEVNGHNHKDLVDALSFDTNIKSKPKCIIAHTIKGHGVSFMRTKYYGIIEVLKGKNINKQFLNSRADHER